jgi:hypothetical protein
MELARRNALFGENARQAVARLYRDFMPAAGRFFFYDNGLFDRLLGWWLVDRWFGDLYLGYGGSSRCRGTL